MILVVLCIINLFLAFYYLIEDHLSLGAAFALLFMLLLTILVKGA